MLSLHSAIFFQLFNPSETCKLSSQYNHTDWRPFRAGVISTVKVLSGSSPITLASITTTLAIAAASASASSVSSQVAALIPIIVAWQANPAALAAGALNTVNVVTGAIDGLISKLGGGSSTSAVCTQAKKRSLLGFLGSLVGDLACVSAQVVEAGKIIAAGDVDGITPIIASIEAGNKELGEDDTDEDNTSEENSSTTESSEHSSGSSTTSSSSSSSSVEAIEWCSPGTCGDACSLANTAPLSGSMSILSTSIDSTGAAASLSLQQTPSFPTLSTSSFWKHRRSEDGLSVGPQRRLIRLICGRDGY